MYHPRTRAILGGMPEEWGTPSLFEPEGMGRRRDDVMSFDLLKNETLQPNEC